MVDIGGSHVKMLVSGADERRRFDSGKELTPHVFVEQVREATADWHYDVVSIGYPGTVDADGPSAEPEISATAGSGSTSTPHSAGRSG